MTSPSFYLRANKLPDPLRTTQVWRQEAESWGLPGLYLLRIESFPDEDGDPSASASTPRSSSSRGGRRAGTALLCIEAGYASRSNDWGHFGIW